MGTMNKSWYREQAIQRFKQPDVTKPQCVDIHSDASVSNGTQPGGWVSAWIFIPDPPKEGEAKQDGKETETAPS